MTSTLTEPHQEQSQDHFQKEWLVVGFIHFSLLNPLTHVEKTIDKRSCLVCEEISQDARSDCGKCRLAWKLLIS